MPKPGKARAVQIDLDPVRIGLRYDVEVGLVGDSRRTLEALLPLVNRNKDRSFPGDSAEGNERVVGADEQALFQHGKTNEAAGDCPRVREAGCAMMQS